MPGLVLQGQGVNWAVTEQAPRGKAGKQYPKGEGNQQGCGREIQRLTIEKVAREGEDKMRLCLSFPTKQCKWSTSGLGSPSLSSDLA